MKTSAKMELLLTSINNILELPPSKVGFHYILGNTLVKTRDTTGNKDVIVTLTVSYQNDDQEQYLWEDILTTYLEGLKAGKTLGETTFTYYP